jgi:dipeptidyl aminopeptidase/acylaminoacyl peptidase
VRRLTWTNPELDELHLGAMEVVRYKSKDEMEIEGVLVRPAGYKEGTKYPLLTFLHGGPALNFRLAFTPYGTSPQAQRYPVHVFAGRGYAVFCPNVRGSAGYGEKFRKANVRDWGGGDYQDVQLGIDRLIKQGIADPNRLGVMGWSYGGFLTAWSLTQTDRFKAASMGAGIFNPTSFYGQTDVPSFMETYFGGAPWEVPKVYARSSPLGHAGAIRTPTLIQFGDRDERVPLSQGEEMHRALVRLGVPVEFAVYPRQGHVVNDPKAQVDVLQRNVDWFERWLKKK